MVKAFMNMTTEPWHPVVGWHRDREGRLCAVGVSWRRYGLFVFLRGLCSC